MDDAVVRAMARWPDVPAVYGWLSLDRRGRWRLRGELLQHQGVIGFINRNYSCDERRCWFFQNGPQRVYLALDAAPFVFSLDGEGVLRAHTGEAAGVPTTAWLTDTGQLFLRTPQGPGMIDDRDLETLADGLSLREQPVERPGDGLDAAVEALLEAPERLAEEPLWLHRSGGHDARWSLRLRYLPAIAIADELGFESRPVEPSAAPETH